MKNLLWLLVGALITLLVPAALSEPINKLFRGDRLIGTMEIARWEANPAEKVPPAPRKERTSEEIFQDIQKDLTEIHGAKNSYAVLTLRNDSDKVVDNVRLKFQDYAADILLDRENEVQDVLQRDVKEIVIPQMKQGDEVVYRIWSSGMTPEYLKDDISTHSSAGPFRMTYIYPDNEYETERSTIEWIVEDVFPYIGVGLLLIFAVIMSILSSHYENLLKRILKDENVYKLERDKYNSDPQNYNPVTSSYKTGNPY